MLFVCYTQFIFSEYSKCVSYICFSCAAFLYAFYALNYTFVFTGMVPKTFKISLPNLQTSTWTFCRNLCTWKALISKKSICGKPIFIGWCYKLPKRCQVVKLTIPTAAFYDKYVSYVSSKSFGKVGNVSTLSKLFPHIIFDTTKVIKRGGFRASFQSSKSIEKNEKLKEVIRIQPKQI